MRRKPIITLGATLFSLFAVVTGGAMKRKLKALETEFLHWTGGDPDKLAGDDHELKSALAELNSYQVTDMEQFRDSDRLSQTTRERLVDGFSAQRVGDQPLNSSQRDYLLYGLRGSIRQGIRKNKRDAETSSATSTDA